MECQICELHQKRFTCANCLRSNLREHRRKLIKATKERQASQEDAERLSRTVEGARTLRADLYRTEIYSKDLLRELEKTRRANDAARTRVAALRTQLATRRANLLSARSVSAPAYSSKMVSQASDPMAEWVANLDDTNYRLIQTRRSLVEELVEAFDLGETDVSAGRLSVGSIPPTGPIAAWNATGFGRHASKFGSEFFLRPSISSAKKVQPTLKWTICGLVLPSPSEVRKSVQDGIPVHTIEEINAAIEYTLRFVSVLCFYLGVKLPFLVRWSGGKQGVGIPYLKAGSGPAFGNWSRWIAPCALYLNPGLANASQVLSDKFSVAYSMLAYNVCYLAYTQTISIPLAQSGNILANLWTLCSEDKSIGHFSHETTSSSLDIDKPAAIWPPVTGSGVGVSHPLHHDRVLAAPTPAPSEFPLDFNDVIMLLAEKPVQPPSEAVGTGGLEFEDEAGEGWAVVELDEDGF